MPNAAVGFRVHSGWAAMVAVALEKGAPVVLERKRVHLVETFSYTFRQPYHTAEKMEFAEARKFIVQVQKEARQLAYRRICGMQAELEKLGMKLARGSLLLASGRPLPSLEKILGSHALIHTADGELFREAIVHGCERCGVKMEGIPERGLLDRAGEALKLKHDPLLRRVTELGKPHGAPWSQDEKFATLAAWVALNGRTSDIGRIFKNRREQKN
jgi:hypothetical protein